MKKVALTLLTILLVAIVLVGPVSLFGPAAAYRAELEHPAVVMETLDYSLKQYEEMWRAEIGRRFSNAVGVFVHGSDIVDGQWVVKASFRPGHLTPVKKLLADVRERHPTRTIVLISCNPGHLKLGIPGVYYAKANIWCVPDRHLETEKGLTRWKIHPDAVGNIYEFVTDPH